MGDGQTFLMGGKGVVTSRVDQDHVFRAVYRTVGNIPVGAEDAVAGHDHRRNSNRPVVLVPGLGAALQQVELFPSWANSMSSGTP